VIEFLSVRGVASSCCLVVLVWNLVLDCSAELSVTLREWQSQIGSAVDAQSGSSQRRSRSQIGYVIPVRASTTDRSNCFAFIFHLLLSLSLY
jgi:hypothetical protein